MPSVPVRALLPAALLVGLVGCSSSSSAVEAIGVESSDTACTLSSTSAPAGSTTFSVRNTGSETTELYIHRTDGTLVSEVEDITPGLTRELTVDLAQGSYQLTCKPGERDPGFSQAFTVTPAGE